MTAPGITFWEQKKQDKDSLETMYERNSSTATLIPCWTILKSGSFFVGQKWTIWGFDIQRKADTSIGTTLPSGDYEKKVLALAEEY